MQGSHLDRESKAVSIQGSILLIRLIIGFFQIYEKLHCLKLQSALVLIRGEVFRIATARKLNDVPCPLKGEWS